ncbi:PD40 domain-containing protein, partial [bacterium]|nr:PD40 domain-containing protein [bacterium]
MRKLIILLVFVFSLSTLICATAPSDVKIYDMRGLESQQLILGAEYKISCTDSDALGGIEFQYSTDDGGSWNLLTLGTLISTGKYSAVFNVELEIDKVRALDTVNTATSDEYSVTVSEANSICIPGDSLSDKTNPCISPDGQWVAYEQSDGTHQQIYMASIETGNVIPMTAEAFDVVEPSFSPNGHWLSYVKHE